MKRSAKASESTEYTLFQYYKDRDEIITFHDDQNQHLYKVDEDKLVALDKKILDLCHVSPRGESSKDPDIPDKKDLCHVPYTSTTTLIKAFFPEFNEDEVIVRYELPEKNPKYLGMTPEEIKAKWKWIREDASEKGKIMHEYLEKILKNQFVHERDFNEDAYKSVCMLADKLDEIQTNKELKECININTFSFFKSEWRIFHEDFHICGTIDCVLIEDKNDMPWISAFRHHEKRKRAILIDWKRS